jgi:hypothetical protein
MAIDVQWLDKVGLVPHEGALPNFDVRVFFAVLPAAVSETHKGNSVYCCES